MAKATIKLILILTLLSTSLKAQPLLGYSKSEVVQRKGYGYTVDALETGGYRLTYDDQTSIDMYFFNNDAVCLMSTFGTKLASKVNTMVEDYNNTSVIIDNFNWKYYTDDGQVVYISLRRYAGITTFVYSYVPLSE